MRRPISFLVALSIPALTLATAFGVNNPSLYHLVLTRFVDEGIFQADRYNTALAILGLFGLATSAIFQPAFGLLSDRTQSRFGRRYPYMMVGAIGMMLALLAEIHAVNFVMLVIAVIATHIALSAVQSPLHALIPDLVSKQQMGLASGLKTVLELVGIIVGGAITWLLLGRNNQPELVAITLSLITLGAILWTYHRVPEDRQAKTDRPLSSRQRFDRLYFYAGARWTFHFHLSWLTLRHVGRRRSFTWWLVHRVFLFASFGIISKFTITYLVDVFGFTADEARAMQGQIIFFLGILIMATPLIGGVISDRIGRRRLVIIASFIAACSTFVISQANSLNLAIGMMAITGIGTSLLFSVGWAMVTSIVPTRQAGFYMGLTNIATSLGTALGLMGGFVVDIVNDQTDSTRMGYTVILALGAFFYLASAAAIAQTQETLQPLPETLPQQIPVVS